MRYAILGNSGSGKSTLARALASFHSLTCLDLDVVAWVPGTVGVPREPSAAAADVSRFCAGHHAFVLEGCYENLIAASLDFGPHLVFLDVSAELCEMHCRSRPYEPHKYESREAQDRKLEFLLTWVRAYQTREGTMSRGAHEELYEAYDGPKSRFLGEVGLDPFGEIVGIA